MYTLLRYLYSLLLTLALPLIFLRLYLRSIKVPSYRMRWLERLGIIKATIEPGGIWIHAVSVGEVVAAIPLINALQLSYPHMPITVTTTTPTGSQRLQQSIGDKVNHMYMPYDVAWALQDILHKIRPKVLLIMETELWPNLLYKCKQQEIPVIIVNARISDKSLRGYKRIKPFTARLLQQVTLVLAQSDQDGERFVELGLAPDKLEVVGNLKFDVEIPQQQQLLGMALKGKLNNRQVWVAASTHAGEEEQILTAFATIHAKWPDCLLILVPRHPNRFDDVANLIEKHGFSYVRRSTDHLCTPDTAVLLGDTMGELNIFYAAADLAFVGGSLVPIGGHNLLEPAAAGIAMMTGPHMNNFKEITDKLLENQAVFIVHNMKQITQQVEIWLSNTQLRGDVGARGLAVIVQNRGTTAKVIYKLAHYFGAHHLGLS